MATEQITVEEFHRRLMVQRVTSVDHAAVVCPICGTVQSLASLIRAGADPDRAERMIGFACEGRLRDAGPWPSDKDKSAKAKARRQVRGCDWSLGGLFQIHELEVMADGVACPRFRVASPEQAQALEAAAAVA